MVYTAVSINAPVNLKGTGTDLRLDNNVEGRCSRLDSHRRRGEGPCKM
jgi:hypothetical protein